MKKHTKKHVTRPVRKTAGKKRALFASRYDWFLWVAATVFISLSVFTLFGLLPL